MSQIEKKQVCKCEKCGNEAEMVVTCTLPEHDRPDQSKSVDAHKDHADVQGKNHVKGTATCSHCGNEADMWVDL